MARLPAEATDSKLAALMGELNRPSLSEDDLKEANAYAEMLELHKTTRPEPELDWRGKALTLALAVSYARPFSSNRNRDGKKEKPDFLAPMVDELTESELAVHKAVIGDRDHFYAHSDAEFRPTTPASLDGPKGKRRAFFQKVLVAYSPAQARQIRANVGKLNARVEARHKIVGAEIKAIDAAFPSEGRG